jgi:hypothetical protein
LPEADDPADDPQCAEREHEQHHAERARSSPVRVVRDVPLDLHRPHHHSAAAEEGRRHIEAEAQDEDDDDAGGETGHRKRQEHRPEGAGG